MYVDQASEEDVSMRILLETTREHRQAGMSRDDYQSKGRLLGVESFLLLARQHPIVGYGLRYARGFF